MPKMPDIPTLTPYKMDIQQGNVVTQEMISKLQAGMTRSQVRFALGTPLVVDPFRENRWDYVYRYDKRGEQIEYRRIVVIFEGDKLVRIEGDVVPAKETAGGAAKAADTPAPAAKPETLPATAAKPEVAAPQPKPEPAAAPPPAGTNLVTSTGEPVTASGAQPAAGAEKAKEEKPKEEAQKPQEERGFFGRMLDKLGF